MLHTPSISKNSLLKTIKKSTYFIFLLLFFSFLFINSYAQAPKNSPYVWGQVPKEHLEMKVCPIDTSAAAVVLSDFGEWKFKNSGKGLGFRAILQRHIRIKILSDAGLDFAEGSIQFVHTDKFEKLSKFQGQTINQIGGRIVYEPIEKEHKTKIDLTDDYSEFKFVFPRVKAGTIIEYTYELSTRDILKLKTWNFQIGIPTLYSELKINKIKNLTHTPIPYHVLKKDQKKDLHWVKENIPALIDEPYVNNIENHRAKIEFEINKLSKTYYSRGYYGTTANKVNRSMFDDWDELRRAYEPPDFVFNKDWTSHEELRADIDSMLSSVPEADTLKKLKIIYDFVKDSMEWNGIYSPKANSLRAPEYLAHGEGNSAVINTVLRTMLELAGVPCAGMIISTVDHGQPIDLPVASQFNHFIIVAGVKGTPYFLDAINPLRPYYLLSMNDFNDAGYLLMKKNSGWNTIPNKRLSTQQILANLTLDEEGNLKGELSERFNGYFALEMRELFKELEEKDEKEEFWKSYKDEELVDTEMSDEKIVNEDDEYEALELNYKIESSDFANAVGDYIYLNPVLFFAETENRFVRSERKFDIEMGCKYEKRFYANFTIPDGYKVESLPKAARIVLTDRVMIFQFSCDTIGNQIQIMSDFQTALPTFPAESYSGIKQLFDHMVAKHGEQIVLKKI